MPVQPAFNSLFENDHVAISPRYPVWKKHLSDWGAMKIDIGLHAYAFQHCIVGLHEWHCDSSSLFKWTGSG